MLICRKYKFVLIYSNLIIMSSKKLILKESLSYGGWTTLTDRSFKSLKFR